MLNICSECVMIYRFAMNEQSKDEGEHGLSSLRILISKLFLVSSVLLNRPFRHLHNRKNSKDVSRVVSCQQRVKDPAKSLPKVVCATDLVEPKTIGDLSFFRHVDVLFVVFLLWRSPEVSQDLVAFVVQQLNYGPKSNKDSSCRGGIAVSWREKVKF